jgi:Mor family transcriptional regulator
MLELTREQLWQWYVVEKKTSVEIANEVGLKPNTIRARLAKVGIPVRSRGEAQVLAVSEQAVDAEALAALYRAGQSPQQLAEHFGTTRARIIAQLRRQGIYEENRTYSGDRHWCTGKSLSREHVQKIQASIANHGAHTGPTVVPVQERFWKYVEKTDGCWLWKGATEGVTYGRIYDATRKEKVLAHRVSWEIHHGVIPEGQNVLHRCDNPACVNPEHLFLGTHVDNAQDMVSKFRGHCVFKNKDTVVEILDLHSHGHSGRSLAKMFGVSVDTIYRILHGRSYGHVAEVQTAACDAQDLSRRVFLSDEDVRFIRKARHCDSHAVAELAQIFGVTTVTIYNVVNRRTHQHIADELPLPPR